MSKKRTRTKAKVTKRKTTKRKAAKRKKITTRTMTTRTTTMVGNPDWRHKKYIGHIGDDDPIVHWGGIIYDAGYGPHLTYFQSYEDMVSVYDFPIEDNVLEDLDWVDWDGVASYIGMDVSELKGYAVSDNVFARADVYASVGSYHGFSNLDHEQQEMTLKKAEGKYGRAVDAAHRAEQKARTGARNPRGKTTKRKVTKHTKNATNVRSLVAKALK